MWFGVVVFGETGLCFAVLGHHSCELSIHSRRQTPSQRLMLHSILLISIYLTVKVFHQLFLNLSPQFQEHLIRHFLINQVILILELTYIITIIHIKVKFLLKLFVVFKVSRSNISPDRLRLRHYFLLRVDL